jgi:Family of unknown function (DUF6510)
VDNTTGSTGADDVGEDAEGDVNRALMLDANAVAGVLYEIFSSEMSSGHTECQNCGRKGEIGSLLAFTNAPGIVLRCPACESVVMRITRTERVTYLDARGAVYIRIERSTV